MTRAGRGGGAPLDGVAVVDKPAGWTSHDVVGKARGLLGTRRVGHGGTLDPDATGVLVLGVGAVTRLLRFVGGHDKSYEGVVVLGATTTTLDSSGEVTATFDMADVTLDAARAAARSLTGRLAQVPPMVSAKKVGGRRLHALARAGVEIDREPVDVMVHVFEVGSPVGPGQLPVRVVCSAGTYVRALAADLGAALGGGAHLRALRRVASGPFTLEEAVPLEQLAPERLLAPVAALRPQVPVVVDDEIARAISYGRALTDVALGVEGDGPFPLVDEGGRLLAVYERRGPGELKPAVVLAPAG